MQRAPLQTEAVLELDQVVGPLDAAGAGRADDAVEAIAVRAEVLVHQVIEPLPVLQYEGNVRVTDDATPVGVTTLAQWTSRRSLSSASLEVS